LTEVEYLRAIPKHYRDYSNGIIKNPKERDLSYAIEFGKRDKDNRSLEYAYLTKFKIPVWGTPAAYCNVYTPLRLISEHSKNCARNYSEIDNEMILYLQNMEVVKLSLEIDYMVSTQMYGFETKLILLRDGKKVPAIKEIPAINRNNPFDLLIVPEIDDFQKKMLFNTYQYTQYMTASMSQEQLVNYCYTLKKMGLDDEEISRSTGIYIEKVKDYVKNI
jgi:hypothetical protein